MYDFFLFGCGWEKVKWMCFRLWVEMIMVNDIKFFNVVFEYF